MGIIRILMYPDAPVRLADNNILRTQWMFEFEIMVTGYTVVVAASIIAVSRYIYRKKIDLLNLKLSELQRAVKTAENEIRILEKEIDDRTNS